MQVTNHQQACSSTPVQVAAVLAAAACAQGSAADAPASEAASSSRSAYAPWGWAANVPDSVAGAQATCALRLWLDPAVAT